MLRRIIITFFVRRNIFLKKFSFNRPRDCGPAAHRAVNGVSGARLIRARRSNEANAVDRREVIRQADPLLAHVVGHP